MHGLSQSNLKLKVDVNIPGHILPWLVTLLKLLNMKFIF